jgi:hypothetical protein
MGWHTQDEIDKMKADGTKQAYGDAASAAYNMVASWDISTVIAIGVMGFIGAMTLFVGEMCLHRYGVNLDISFSMYIIIPIVLVILSKILFAFFEGLMLPVAALMCIIFLGCTGLLFFTGNGSLAPDFRTVKFLSNDQAIHPLYAPSAEAERITTFGTRADLDGGVIGENNGWLLVEIGGGIGIEGAWGWVKAEDVSIKNGEMPRLLQRATVISNTLNIRQFPRMLAGRDLNLSEDGILPQAVKGDIVYVTGEEKNGFVPICMVKGRGLIRGYALVNSLSIEGLDEEGSKELVPPDGIPATTVGSYNMRSGEYNSARYAAKTITSDDTVILLDPEPSENGWMHVWFDGEEGWLSRRAFDIDQ